MEKRIEILEKKVQLLEQNLSSYISITNQVLTHLTTIAGEFTESLGRHKDERDEYLQQFEQIYYLTDKLGENINNKYQNIKGDAKDLVEKGKDMGAELKDNYKSEKAF